MSAHPLQCKFPALARQFWSFCTIASPPGARSKPLFQSSSFLKEELPHLAKRGELRSTRFLCLVLAQSKQHPLRPHPQLRPLRSPARLLALLLILLPACPLALLQVLLLALLPLPALLQVLLLVPLPAPSPLVKAKALVFLFLSLLEP